MAAEDGTIRYLPGKNRALGMLVRLDFNQKSIQTVDSTERTFAGRLRLEGSRWRLPEASRTPPGAASSARPRFSPADVFSAEPTAED